MNIPRSAARPPAGTQPAGPAAAGESPRFELRGKRHGILAWAREYDGEFTVLEGLGARPSWEGAQHSYRLLHQKLVRDQVIVPGPDDGTWRFATSYVFASPSAAAAVVVGHQANGREMWKIEGSTISYGTWQAEDLDQSLTGREKHQED